MNAMIEASWQRLHDERNVYLITLSIKHSLHGAGAGGLLGAAYPQAYAVADDFGNLVIVRSWQ